MRIAVFFTTVSVLSIAACGGDDPTGPAVPDLVGVYDGTWTTTVEGSGLETTTDVCVGEVTVTEQSGGFFEGTFSQAESEGCEAANGFVTGAITTDGTVTVLLGASGGGGPAFEESTGCTIVSSDSSYSGTYDGGALSFGLSLTARCPDTGSVDVIWTFSFDSP